MDTTTPIHVGRIVNVASVPQRSPFRYPGGKTWLVPLIRVWLRTLDHRPRKLVEPFAGGAIIGLTAAFEELVDEVMLVEIDDDVSAVWQTMLNGDGARLANKIASFRVTPDAVERVFATPPASTLDRAFVALLKNRVNRGGIMAPGASVMKAGENGRGIASRWYPETLQRRILAIAGIRDRIAFVHGDGLDAMRQHAAEPGVVFFIDPPYTVAGRRLYTHHALDHDTLFRLASSVAGDLLMTYDNTDEIRRLAEKHGFDTQEVAMKNTHHATKTELLVGRDLEWARPRTLF